MRTPTLILRPALFQGSVLARSTSSAVLLGVLLPEAPLSLTPSARLHDQYRAWAYMPHAHRPSGQVTF